MGGVGCQLAHPEHYDIYYQVFEDPSRGTKQVLQVLPIRPDTLPGTATGGSPCTAFFHGQGTCDGVRCKYDHFIAPPAPGEEVSGK